MRTCAFCGGKFKGQTKDHVPPRCLFGNNPSGNLITVPACVKCNNDTSNDDELFRLIALENKAAELTAAKDVAEATYRALLHPKKEGFKRYVFDRIEPTGPIPEGDVDPRTMVPGTMTLPLRRILPTVRKTIRGLFYKIKGRPLPPEYMAEAFLMETLVENLPDSELSALRGVVQDLLSQPALEVGEGVFQYRTFSEGDDPNEMHFLLVFYNRFIFYGFIASEVKYRDMEDGVDRS